MESDARLTLVIPAYMEQKTLCTNLLAILDQLTADNIDAKLIVVDDGSRDHTWQRLCEFASERSNVGGIRLSRNFGKETAIFAGISQVQTEYCLVMDSDLQHPPRYIKEFLRVADETGADIIEGVKDDRGRESLSYRLFAKGFYRLLKSASGVDLGNSSDFKLLSRKAIDALCQFREGTVFFRGLVNWSGFTTATVPFSVDARQGDSSKFSSRRLLRFAVDSMLAYTSKPVYLTFLFSVLFFIGTLILGVYTLVNYFSGHSVSGFSTLIILILLLGCLILLSLGVIGLYIARIYDEVKRRPRFLVGDTCQLTPTKFSRGGL